MEGLPRLNLNTQTTDEKWNVIKLFLCFNGVAGFFIFWLYVLNIFMTYLDIFQ